jgi:hypothetical protein
MFLLICLFCCSSVVSVYCYSLWRLDLRIALFYSQCIFLYCIFTYRYTRSHCTILYYFYSIPLFTACHLTPPLSTHTNVQRSRPSRAGTVRRWRTTLIFVLFFLIIYNISRLVYYPIIFAFIYASVVHILLFKQVSNAGGSDHTCAERVISILHFRSDQHTIQLEAQLCGY